MAGLVFLPFVDFRATFIYVDVDWLIGIESAESGISAAFFSRQPVASLDDQKMATEKPTKPRNLETSPPPKDQLLYGNQLVPPNFPLFVFLSLLQLPH